MSSPAFSRLLLAAIAALTAAGSAVAADVHLGVATCASSTCHGAAKPATSGNIEGNEYVTWSRFDPHAGAYAVLLEERSRVMARRLGIAAPEQSAECLGCHTDNQPAAARGPRFQLDDGVGCEVCHGGAPDWIASHDDRGEGVRIASLARGMTDLTDAATRAGICVACHVGGERGFASHRLMAAGHPRLGFELDTFTELWRTSGGRAHYRPDADYARRKPTPGAAQVWASGLAAAALAHAELISVRYGGQGPFPDFALFNCYSCHRTMKLADWRDRSTPTNGDPGALRFDDSSLTMLVTALGNRTAERGGLQRDIAALQEASSRSGADVREAASRLSSTLRDVAGALDKKPLTAGEAEAALGALASAAAGGAYPDYTRAEQAAMGVAVLAASTGKAARNRKAIDALFAALEDDERYDPRRFGAALQALGR